VGCCAASAPSGPPAAAPRLDLACCLLLTAGDLSAPAQLSLEDPAHAQHMAAKLAAWLLYMMGVLMAGVLALHFLALLVWQALSWTRQYPLPYFLVFPVPEVLLANVLVLPLAMAATALLVLPAGAHARALGAAGMLALLAYLLLVAAVLLALARRQKQLGLSYIKLGRSTAAAGDRIGQSASCWPQRGSKASVLNSKSPFQTPASKAADKLAPAARMLLQFSPPHSHGYWERADVALQQELRRCYQRECGFGCLSGAKCYVAVTPQASRPCRLLAHINSLRLFCPGSPQAGAWATRCS
jgi:hypothetical protein